MVLKLSGDEIPSAPVLNFQVNPTTEANKSSILDDVLTVLEVVSSFVGVVLPVGRIPETLGKIKKHGDNILTLFGNGETLFKLFSANTPEKERDYSAAASEIAAKLNAIKESRGFMLDEAIPAEDKITHVGPAIQTCAEVLNLFDDKKYLLWYIPIPASELLMNFAAVYVEIAVLSVCLLPSHNNKLHDSMQALKQTLLNYKKHCIYLDEKCPHSRLSQSQFVCKARSVESVIRPGGMPGFRYGYWMYQDNVIRAMVTATARLPTAFVEFHCSDTWPSVWHNGKLEAWAWNGKGQTSFVVAIEGTKALRKKENI